ncbi:MAG: hypothetical protein FJ189_02960, partial [Gammaproteobacteria bacterium]|nr:hypothetical protein [Gammaproteobacteria bacterium]
MTFTTPAFLGNAEQSGQWRTPPFKALLRQWWRVVYASRNGFDVDVAKMRKEEGMLFGHAWLDDDLDTKGKKVSARKGAVRMRLDNWSHGKLKVWPSSDVTIKHPEVANPVGSQLYLGYGSLVFRSGTGLKANAAIQAGEHAQLSVAVPEDGADAVVNALTLMNAYGAAGGRSRNGWGSFVLHPIGGASPREKSGYHCVRAWLDCL